MDILNASLSPSSHRLYTKTWHEFDNFHFQYFKKHATLPINDIKLALYVARLHQLHLSASTIASRLSAISFIHSVLGFKSETSVFLVKKALKGVHRLTSSYDVRLPITENILLRLLSSLAHFMSNIYERKLFTAIFTLAFYALARIGELIPIDASRSSTVLQIEDVTFESHKVGQSRMRVSFCNFKHNVGKKPHLVPVGSCEDGSFNCPVEAMKSFLAVRGPSSGPLFLSQTGKVLLRSRFDKVVKSSLGFCGLDSSRYKGHSFRIGGASAAAEKGFTDSQIRLLGRWKSDAFKKYIRATAINS